MTRQPSIALFALTVCSCVLSVRAEDQTQPTINTMIGGLFFTGEHLYMAESSVHLPIFREHLFSLSYEQHEVTPVFREDLQTQLLNSRNRLEADITFGEQFRWITIGGYHRTALEDRAGSLSAYEIGGGLGSPLGSKPPRLEWSAVAGGYVSRQRLDSDWWADLHVMWRAYELRERQMLETAVQPCLGLAADVQSSNDSDQFRALYRIGPVLDVYSANGNHVRFRAQWYANDGNPFFETRDSALLVGAEVSSSLDKKTLFDARDHRPLGWVPLVWGQYDAGYGGDRTIQRTELNAEIHDIMLAEHVVTPVLWYESRQEYRPGDYDNVAYSVSFGAQTRVGLASLLSQGQPLVFGAEYLHRSSHALAPSDTRVPPPAVLPHDSVNIFRARLQTLGWDVPYRDPTIYEAKTEWLNNFDWRITSGYDFYHSRSRDAFAGQLGLNWDAATVRGCVIYARGLGSVGTETPDWQLECGVRRPAGKLFFRYESYGLDDSLARGNTAVIGIGFHL